MIKRSVSIEVTPTPDEMADAFWMFDADMQADFLRALYYRGPARRTDRLEQFERIRQSECMNNQSRKIMSEIGEYSDRPEEQRIIRMRRLLRLAATHVATREYQLEWPDDKAAARTLLREIDEELKRE